MSFDSLSEPLELKSAEVLDRRVFKAATSEGLAEYDGRPNRLHRNLYELWGRNLEGCLMITGNIMVDSSAKEGTQNLWLEDDRHLEDFAALATVVKETGAHIWGQISHPGGQALKSINSVLWGPSDIKNSKIQALDKDQIAEQIERFANTAKLLKEAGFTGVQIHAAHGYLLSQFLSPAKNQRDDKWGGSLENRSRFLLEVVRAVRERVGETFSVGVKINASDYGGGGFDGEVGDVAQRLEQVGIDLLEISGGTYEHPAMTGWIAKEEAYFLTVAKDVKHRLKSTPVMVTGGFTTASTMKNAVKEGQTDLVGLARPLVLNPEVVQQILHHGLERVERVAPKRGWINLIENRALQQTAWWQWHLKRLAQGETPDFKASMTRSDLAAWKSLRGYNKAKSSSAPSQ